MKYIVKDNVKNVVEVEITLTNKEWEEEINGAYLKHKHKYAIEGFRKGHAPKKVIENMYGPQVFVEDALSDAFTKHYSVILQKEKELDPIDAPDIQVKSLDEKGLVIVAHVPVMPTVTLGAYKNLEIKVKTKEVKDKDVKDELKKVQEQNARLEESADAVKMGDIVNLDFAGYIDGKKFDGGTAEGYELEIGSHSFIDTFEDQLVGLNVGDKKDVLVSFPDNYQVEELRAKPATFKVVINAVKNKILPELTDAFASEVSEFENLEDYKNSIKANLTAKYENDAKLDAENKIIDKIVSGVKVDLADVLVERELDGVMQDLEYRLMYQGLNIQDYAKYLNVTVEELRKERHKDAVKSLKIRLALQQIIKVENLDLTKEEIDNKIKEMAKLDKKTIKEYKESLDENRLNHMKNDILMNKLLSFLLENNK